MNELNSRRDIEEKILKKAWEDPAFKEELRKEPRRAIEKALGATLPESITIHVHEETPGSVHIVIPLDREAELTEAEVQSYMFVNTAPNQTSGLSTPASYWEDWSSSGCKDSMYKNYTNCK